MQKLISIDLKADFGFFRKPDANNTISLSYNIAHKPAILGILGAIIGLGGYKEKSRLPEYYNKLCHIKIGIAPLRHEKGNFQKMVIKYSNTIGYANKGTTYLTEEATLIKPAYRIYILLDMEQEDEQKLYNYLKNGEAEYLPYFGKNEFAAWWDKDDFKEYEYEVQNSVENSISLKTAFIKEKENPLKDQKASPLFDMFSFMDEEAPYMYFERLPKAIDTNMYQYDIDDYALSTFFLKNTVGISGLYYLKQENYYVQLL